MKRFLKQTLLAGLVALSSASAMAGPIYTFGVSEGAQPSNVGIITLTQNGLDSVNVSVDLLAGYGFLNTGGPHTPFAFNLSGAGPLSINFTTPPGGVYGLNLLTLNTAGGDNTPYGTFGIAIDSNAGNGSNPLNAYYGDLLFTLTDSDGALDTADFVRNLDNAPILGGSYFSADLTDGSNTGAQAWAIRDTPPDEGPPPGNEIPEPASLVLLGSGLVALRLIRRRYSRAA